jgi:hypothetical protein
VRTFAVHRFFSMSPRKMLFSVYLLLPHSIPEDMCGNHSDFPFRKGKLGREV